MHARSSVVAWLTLVAGCAAPTGGGSASTGHTGAGSPVLPAPIAVALADGDGATILVRLDDSGIDDAVDAVLGGARAGAPDAARTQVRARWIAELTSRFVDALPDGARAEHAYRNLAVAAIHVDDLDAADAVLGRPEVIAVDGDTAFAPTLTESLPLIGQPTASAGGFQGAGTAVAVLDTGAIYTHADLGSCSAPGTPASCRVAYAADFATDDGLMDTIGHGTNVSATIARVAPATDILALDVFRADGLAYSTDILAAIDWVVDNQATYGIASINMSLGSGGYANPCAGNVFEAGIVSARAAGVAVAVASGNSAYTSLISSPACVPDAVSVGAVYDSSFGGIGWSGCSDSTTAADKVTCFSNAAYYLDILAPGAMVTAGGYTMGGTSMASPHVAGALAVVRAANPTATVDEVEDKLATTGVSVTDARNGLVFPRLDLAAAVLNCVEAVTPTADAAIGAGDSGEVTVTAPSGCDWAVSSDQSWLTTDAGAGTGGGVIHWTAAENTGGARTGHLSTSGRTVTITQSAAEGPTGTVVIDGGAVGTHTTAVTLTLDAADATEVCVSSSATCTAWESYATAVPWTIASGAGTKTVYATFRDVYGNVGGTVSDTIIYDVTRPVSGTVGASGRDGSATLTFTGFTDASTGIDGYVVVQAVGATPPASSCVDPPVWSGSDDTATVTGLTNGTTYSWRVCGVDGAGNLSTGATASLTPAPEYDPPVGTLTIGGGADWTTVKSQTVTLSATDASGTSRACLSNTSTCSAAAWFTMTDAKTWTIAGTNGTNTVYTWFEDAWGARSAAVSDTIGYDLGKPTNGAVSALGADGAVELTFTGFTDAISGVASYVVVQNTGTSAPLSSCTATPVWSGAASTATITGLTNGTTYTFRVCAVDAAGNVGTGSTVSAVPAPELVAPVGTIAINGSADWANATAATITLDATDASGVASACLSTTTTICTASTWFTYAPERAFTLAGTVGINTVYAWFKDIYGNVSERTSDTIGYERTKPVDGAVSAAGSDGQVVLTMTGYSDATSGIATYKVVQNTGTSAPLSSCTATPVWTGSGTSATLTGLVNGTTYTWRVCAVDAAGNVSTGVTATTTAAPEYTAPVGTIAINGGAAWTNTSAATITLSATDASGVATACLATANTICGATGWFAYTASKAFTLSGAIGTNTVYAWFKDAYGNVSAVTSDTIGLEKVKPVNGTVSMAGSSGQVVLTFAGFTDATAGIASYVVVQNTGTSAPASSCTATPAWTGGADAATLTGLTNGTTYTWRVCAIDAAGNKSTGSTLSGFPASEYVGPVGSVSINAGAAWTNVSTSTVTLAATDASGVATACLATTNTICSVSGWFAYTTSKAFTLAGTAGTNTVYGWFKDVNGNVSAVTSDTIGVDKVKPVNGAVTPSAGDAQVTLSWSGFSDASSGIASFVAVQNTGTSAPAASCTGTAAWTGGAGDTSATFTGLTNGSAYTWRVCARDAAGNTSSGITATATPTP